MRVFTVERDQARSRTQMISVEKENTITELNSKDLELTSLKSELQVRSDFKFVSVR